MSENSLLPKEYSSSGVSHPTTSSSRAFLVLSSVFLCLVVLSWGWVYFYQRQVQAETDKIQESIDKVSFNGRQDEVSKIIEANTRLDSFKSVLDAHVYTSNIFKKIEELSGKTVYFREIKIDVKKMTLDLSGVATSYDSFAEQFSRLRDEDSYFKKVSVSSLVATKDGVDFNLSALLAGGAFLFSK